MCASLYITPPFSLFYIITTFLIPRLEAKTPLPPAPAPPPPRPPGSPLCPSAGALVIPAFTVLLFILTLISEADGAILFVPCASKTPRYPRLYWFRTLFLAGVTRPSIVGQVFSVFSPLLTQKESDAPVSAPLSRRLNPRVAFTTLAWAIR
ncbi:hypothetical protein E2C01_083474 [Portunus trituberculatus]|uniref:Uncharacterized protein n=1 Tax=Portunus trituberculatus TaxID=210409 RepID=A0A5B7J253_PORTR|nr:hypothetical protein [Portunus trituberculatus]